MFQQKCTRVRPFLCLTFLVAIFLLLTTFCENSSNSDKILQRRFYASQLNERKSAIRYADKVTDLIYEIVPQLNCPTKVRVGRVRDGGKWMCSPWRATDSCVIYSIGVGGDASWERQLMQMNPTCSSYSLDPDSNYAILFKNRPKMTFVPLRLGTRNDSSPNTIDFASILFQFGHKKVDFLKIDIERGEFTVLPDILRTAVPICNIFVEIHSFRNDVNEYRALMEMVEKYGFLLYSKEILFCGPPCSEYSFMHLSCLKQYGLQNEQTLGGNF